MELASGGAGMAPRLWRRRRARELAGSSFHACGWLPVEAADCQCDRLTRATGSPLDTGKRTVPRAWPGPNDWEVGGYRYPPDHQ
jgi:hypothetical protein